LFEDADPVIGELQSRVERDGRHVAAGAVRVVLRRADFRWWMIAGAMTSGASGCVVHRIAAPPLFMRVPM